MALKRRVSWRSVLLGLIASGLVASADAWAQISAPARPAGEYKNAFSFGLSYGAQNDRDAWFWGWSADYNRQLPGRWIAAAAIAWDEETERFDDRPNQIVRTFTAIGSVSYELSRRFSLTTGLGKGFADSDNPSGSMRFTDGDLGTGIVLGFATPGLPRYVRDSIGISVAYEYNIDQKETSLSLDVTFGWSF